MMSRKHYIAIAGILNDCWENEFITYEKDFFEVVKQFSEMFADDNDNFDSVRFTEACCMSIK
ncbi:MAG: hypothetical protein CMO16_03760 [Thaumarchaeota archaeon]|nr:hypothetical protein [Nitrososphaerota archaeon]|tara:strand:+ start:126 stop:311 length:186 start_codon:yes stop_codon:yes gene_type:complete